MKKRLCIEPDGGIHLLKENQANGAERTKWLNSMDIRVKRFTNEEVILNIEFVLSEIGKHIRADDA